MMLTTGFKTYFGLFAALWVGALVYGLGTGGSWQGVLFVGYKGGVGEHFGYSVLLGIAGVCFALAVFHVALRDADAVALAQVAHTETAPAVAPPADVSYWPLFVALGAGLVMVGLISNAWFFIGGLVLMAAAGFEWTIQAWADRATGDPATNRELRDALMLPVEIPVVAVIVVAGFAVALSRVLLAVSKVGAIAVFGVVAAIVLAVGALIATRPRIGRSLVIATLLVGAVALLVGGVVGALVGERELHHEGEGTEHSLSVEGS